MQVTGGVAVDRWLINGRAGDSVPVDDRGLAYGDGLFETIAVRDGSCRFLDLHLDRLESGCKRLGIPLPSRTLLQAELRELIGAEVHGTVKIIVTRGTGPRGYQPPEDCAPLRALGLASSRPAKLAPARLRYCDTPLGRNPSLAGLKTLNRLEQVLARAEWDDPEVSEGLMLNDRQEVICGTRNNVFYTLADTLCTPRRDDGGVHGIMRAQVLRLAQEQGIPTSQRPTTRADLAAADDIFLTNALTGAWPVAELAGRSYGRSRVTEAVRAGLVKLGVGECAE
jgi:4-amino-4-deoxychorismate lyase